ncbi:MAG: hypothetical protein ACK5MV_00435 [Aminipila sp.]
MESIVVAIITAVGLIVTQVIISHRQNNIILYRIDQLEEKQDKHNGLIERMVKVEESTKSAHHRIDEIKEEHINEN